MKLRQFLRQATKRERYEVAEICHDSVSYLYQIAGKHRYASALMAVRLEAATAAVAARSGGRVQVVRRDSVVRPPEIFAPASLTSPASGDDR